MQPSFVHIFAYITSHSSQVLEIVFDIAMCNMYHPDAVEAKGMVLATLLPTAGADVGDGGGNQSHTKCGTSAEL